MVNADLQLRGQPTRLAHRTVPPPIPTFLLTSPTDAASIIEQHKRCRVNTVQLCDNITPDVREELRDSLPGVNLGDRPLVVETAP